MNATNIAKLGARIAADRERMGLTQEQLSKILKVSQQAFSGWEKGSIPRRNRLDQLVDLFGTDSETARYIDMLEASSDGATVTKEAQDLRNRIVHGLAGQGDGTDVAGMREAMRKANYAIALAGRLLTEASEQLALALDGQKTTQQPHTHVERDET